MNKDCIQLFEDKVYLGLKKCGADHVRNIGAAVSGGADSVSLLLSLAEFCKKNQIPLKVISVNHFIRPDEETCGDFNFVKDLCSEYKNRGYDVQFFPYELKKGSVSQFAQENACGIEAAARELRYKAFYNFIQKEQLDFLCLAHNQNDNLETLLMRFIQGSSVEASTGIPYVNVKIIRPLLDISREEIESYLKAKNQDWRNDSSNNDINYLRNKIRNVMVPFLNENFSGWQKGILTGAQKAVCDSLVLEDAVQKNASLLNYVNYEEGESQKTLVAVSIDRQEFILLPTSVKTRLILRAMNCLGENSRVPYQFLCDVVNCAADNFTKNFKDIYIYGEKNRLLVKKEQKIRTDFNIFAIIEEEGDFEFPFGTVSVCKGGDCDEVELFVNDTLVPLKMKLPLCIRSFRSDDVIHAANGGSRKIKDIFSSWHVSENLKTSIPVIQELSDKEQKNVCILGSVLGFKDWI